MIYSLTGKLVEKSLDEVVIDVNGVAYLLHIPSTAHSVIPAIGQNFTIYTYLNVKEDDMELYGFSSKEEQKAFKILISVSGVGPKVGLAILSVLSFDRIALAVSSGDFKTFTAASGVGPKLAQRIVLELKGKFDSVVTSGISLSDISQTTSSASNGISQAISALVALGYSQSQAALAVSKLDASLDVQELIKQALKQISKA